MLVVSNTEVSRQAAAVQAPSGTSVSSLPARHACEVMRILLEQGDISGATDAIPELCQHVLQVSQWTTGVVTRLLCVSPPSEQPK